MHSRQAKSHLIKKLESHLELDPSEMLEAFLVLALEVAKRIEEAEGSLDADLILERCREGGGGGRLAGLGGGERGGAGEEGGEDGALHCCVVGL